MSLGPRVTREIVLAVKPHPLLADGDRKGRIIVDNAADFTALQIVTLKDNTGNFCRYQVKRIVDRFIYLGQENAGPHDRSDVSKWQTENGATIEAHEQKRPIVPVDQIPTFTYANDPINAERTIEVDLEGRYINPHRYDASFKPGGSSSQKNQASAPYGYQFIPHIVDKFTAGLIYDKVENTLEGDTEVLTFRNGANIVKELRLWYNENSWVIADSSTNRLGGEILLESGGFLLTEDGEKLSILM